MINRYSSRRGSLSGSFLDKSLLGAKSYDRIAGYFRSSIFEVAGEGLESVDGKIRVICNSDISTADIATAKMAQNALRKEWCDYRPEELQNTGKRFERLYTFLCTGKLEVRVLPNECFGLIHGKAGVITLKDGSQTSFIGSINESKSAWKLNYELLWEDTSPEGIQWIQEEFDALWNDKHAIALSDFIIEDIQRIANRLVIADITSWRKEENGSASVAIESPVYREQLGLWEHQKYFIDLAFKEHKQTHGARYILADQVGLGKTIELAMASQLMALYGDKPILIIVPKTLIWQWQRELSSLLALPSAVWNGKEWIDENELRYYNKGISDISKCPRRIGIISQGLIVSKSPILEHLLSKEYECIIVDEAHRARRQNFSKGKEYKTPVMNNIYDFLTRISLKTKSMLLATATPIQLHPVELWDLLNILSQKNDSVLGSKSSLWRKPEHISEGLSLIMGKETKNFFNPDNWDWIRNPFPPKYEDTTFASIRNHNNMKDDDFVLNKSYSNLLPKEKQRIGNILTKNFFTNYNPYIRHVIRRERKYLEEAIDTKTNEPFLKKIEVKLHGEDNNEALILTGYLKQAYDYAKEFCEALSKRSKSSGFLKTMLLKRIGSSIEAGKKTGHRMLAARNINLSESAEAEDDEIIDSTDIKNLTDIEISLLSNYVNALESNQATDPKYDKTVDLLKNTNMLTSGVIIFSQYFDTARWVAEKLSIDFKDELIGLYAGGSKSGIYTNGSFKKKDKEAIKQSVKMREIKVLVGTDAASEGLNLQTLSNLINLDLPWNPTKLEQRKGRIQRIGQLNDTVHIHNMRYKDSVEDDVHHMLSSRLQSIYDMFGQLPDVLEDVWINVAIGDKAKALEVIDSVPKVHPFENRYNTGVEHVDWETCSRVLDKEEKRKYFEQGW